MNLRDYLLEHKLTQAAFGRQITPPVSQGKVNHWLQGTRRVSLSEALQIQRLTHGAVTVEDLAAQPSEALEPDPMAGVVDIPKDSVLRLADGLELVERRVGLPTRRLVQQPFEGPEKRIATVERRAVDRERLGLDIGNAGQGSV